MLDKSYRGLMNNKQGSFFENRIIGGCIGYDLFNRAFIEKTPEPFKYLSQLVKVSFKEVSRRKLNQILKVH